MKRLFITTLVALGLLYSGPALGATTLSDTELAGVSGGGIDPHLGGQSLPQVQQQPNLNDSGYTPLRQPQSIDGMELTPELFAILQSRIDVERARVLLLNGTTQQNAIALNLENTLSSDIASTNNIFNGGSISLDDVTTGIEINQGNNVNQRHRTQGSLTGSIAGHRYEKSELRRSGTESYEYRAYSLVDQHRRSEYQRTNTSSSAGHVGSTFTSLDDFTSNVLPLHIIEPETFVRIFDFPEIGGTLDAGWFGEYGATLDYTGIQLIGPGLAIDTIKAGGTDNKDMVFGTIVTAPRLDFGDLDGKLCVGTCGNAHWDFGFIGGGQIHPEFVFEDMAPQVDELNLGIGLDFAGIGNGSPLSATPGLFKVDGKVSIKVTPYASATLDLRNLKIAGVNVGTVVADLNVFGNGKGIIGDEWSFDLINKNFAFGLLDEEISVDDMDLELGDPELFSTERLISQDNDTIVEYDAVDVATSSFSESYTHTAFTGGQMTGAEAELLALSDGTLSVDNNSTVALNDHSQQNMRVFNGVNAVSSIAANSLNMGSTPSFNVRPNGVPQLSLSQQNRFNQTR
jgi:hypothetical protein